MKTIQLEIEDKSLDAVLTLIHSLKKGVIKKYEIKDSDISDKEFQETKVYFNECLYDIENKNTELLSEQEYKKEIYTFTEDLKIKYANH